jgi:hypothetical protein
MVVKYKQGTAECLKITPGVDELGTKPISSE